MHNAPKSLLSRRVPDLQFDDLTSNIDQLAAKLNADSVCWILLNCMNTKQRCLKQLQYSDDVISYSDT